VIFGREDRFLNLFADAQRSLPLMAVGRPQARLQPVHVEDVASAFVNSLDNPATFGQIYDLAGPNAYMLREIIAFAGQACGHPRPVIGMPDGLAYLQALAMEFAPFDLLSRDNLDSLSVDNVSAHPFPAELGVRPVSMESVMTDLLARRSPRERYMQLRDRAGR
jgi:NADH dehydrogenase